jgi:hypothetical protein
VNDKLPTKWPSCNKPISANRETVEPRDLAAVASDIVPEIHEQSEGERQASPAAHSEVKDLEAFGIAILVFRERAGGAEHDRPAPVLRQFVTAPATIRSPRHSSRTAIPVSSRVSPPVPTGPSVRL